MFFYCCIIHLCFSMVWNSNTSNSADAVTLLLQDNVLKTFQINLQLKDIRFQESANRASSRMEIYDTTGKINPKIKKQKTKKHNSICGNVSCQMLVVIKKVMWFVVIRIHSASTSTTLVPAHTYRFHSSLFAI